MQHAYEYRRGRAHSSRLPDAWTESGKPGRQRARPAFHVPCCALHETERGSHTTMATATMLLALAAAATALPEDHPTCLAACATLSCARFAPATCAMVERDLGCACAGCACLGRRLAAVASNDTLLNETLLNPTALNVSSAPAAAVDDDDDDGTLSHGHVRPPRGRGGRRRRLRCSSNFQVDCPYPEEPTGLRTARHRRARRAARPASCRRRRRRRRRGTSG